MAGDWIKVEHATRQKPEVLLAAEMLGISRREAVGLFLDYFLWLDEALPAAFANRDAVVTHMSRKSFDMVLDCAGFAATLECIGWAQFDDDARTLTVINADSHNGKAAKSRCLARNRMKRMRDDVVTPTASLEKRREEKKKNVEEKAAAPQITSPSDKHRALAAELGVNCDSEWAAFNDKIVAKGKAWFTDKAAAFSGWLRQERKYAERDGRLPKIVAKRQVAL